MMYVNDLDFQTWQRWTEVSHEECDYVEWHCSSTSPIHQQIYIDRLGFSRWNVTEEFAE